MTTPFQRYDLGCKSAANGFAPLQIGTGSAPIRPSNHSARRRLGLGGVAYCEEKSPLTFHHPQLDIRQAGSLTG